MVIYEKYTGKARDDYKSFEDLTNNYKLKWKDDFNFAYDVIDELGKTKPDKLAMLWVSNEGEEKYFTFKDMMLMSNKAANYFKSLGLKKGDFVLLVLKRSYLFWTCILGLHKLGCVAVQATNMLMVKDYVYRCNAAKIKAVLITGDGECTEHFDEGREEYKTVKYKLVSKHKNAGDDWIDLEEGLEKASSQWTRPKGEDNPMAKDIMLVAFSSGTTGYPKMIAHDFTYPLGHIMTGVFWHRVIDGGLHFTISDTGWLKSLWGKFYGQWFGETALFVYDFEKFKAEDILSKLEKYKITTFCVPPTMYRLLLQCDVSKYDLSSIKHCNSAGEALNPEIFNKWKQATGLEIYEGFGQSETAVCLCTLYPYFKPIPGSMGMPSPGYTIKLFDAEGRLCPAGVTGEICIKAENNDTQPRGLLREYYKNEASNKRAFYDGYYHTGDTAFRREDGRFSYVGRNDDVIKSSGYRIGPFEIESVLLEHPAVLEVAVTGVPDPIRGFNVKATIVLMEGYEPSDELIKELQNFVKHNTAPYKYPRVVEFVKELPKTFSGKIRRVEIRENDKKKLEEKE